MILVRDKNNNPNGQTKMVFSFVLNIDFQFQQALHKDHTNRHGV